MERLKAEFERLGIKCETTTYGGEPAIAVPFETTRVDESCDWPEEYNTSEALLFCFDNVGNFTGCTHDMSYD